MSDSDRDALETRIANIKEELARSEDQLAEVNARDEAAKPKKKESEKPAPKKEPVKHHTEKHSAKK